MKWLLLLGLAAAACDKHEAAPEGRAVPVLTESEVKRGQDACQAYVAKVCGCADKQPALKEQCALARALPDALQTTAGVAANGDSTRRDMLQSGGAVRRIVKECIEDTAKLPGLGCQ